jgi:hypothetical protein
MFKWGLLVLFLLFLAFAFDTQLIVLRDEGTFTLRYDVPKELEGNMFTIAEWSSNSFMCRHLSWGSGRFERTEYGTSVENVEKTPGVWESDIPTKLWHPFCDWRFNRLTIGVDVNKEKNDWYTLANGYLYNEKKQKSDDADSNKTQDDKMSKNEDLLICDRMDYYFKEISDTKPHEEHHYSLECKNPLASGATFMVATPSVGFLKKDFGILNVKYSGVNNLYSHINFYDESKNRETSYTKNIKYSHGYIQDIYANLHGETHWKVSIGEDGKFNIVAGKTGPNDPDIKLSLPLAKEQLDLLAADDVWELPELLTQLTKN